MVKRVASVSPLMYRSYSSASARLRVVFVLGVHVDPESDRVLDVEASRLAMSWMARTNRAPSPPDQFRRQRGIEGDGVATPPPLLRTPRARRVHEQFVRFESDIRQQFLTARRERVPRDLFGSTGERRRIAPSCLHIWASAGRSGGRGKRRPPRPPASGSTALTFSSS